MKVDFFLRRTHRLYALLSAQILFGDAKNGVVVANICAGNGNSGRTQIAAERILPTGQTWEICHFGRFSEACQYVEHHIEQEFGTMPDDLLAALHSLFEKDAAGEYVREYVKM